MTQLDALERDASGLCAKLGPGPLERERFFEVPPQDGKLLFVEEIDRAVAACELSSDDILMPGPEAVDRRDAVLEHEGRVLRSSREAMNEVVHAAFAVVEVFGLHLQA